MKKEDLRIVFFGTPEFAVASLEELIGNGYNIAGVVTMPDKTGGRGNKIIESDVKRCAVKHELPVLQPEKLKNPEFIDSLRKLGGDLFIVIAFRMLPEIVWTMPKLGTFNLHASLLPKYRGAAPINRAIMNGETETGVTTFFLEHEIDTGDIIDQQTTPIGPDENVGEVYDRLMSIGAHMVLETVNKIVEGNLTTSPQPNGEFIPAPKIFKEDCKINWGRNNLDIHNLVRGLSPYPAAYTTMIDKTGKNTDIKIFRTELVDSEIVPKELDNAPGSISVKSKDMFVRCKDGALKILSLQPAGKKRMDISAFLLGYHPVKFI